MAKTPPVARQHQPHPGRPAPGRPQGRPSALTLALDQMRTLAHSPRYWERYLGLLRNPLARLVDLLVIKQGERIAHQKGWKLPRPRPRRAAAGSLERGRRRRRPRGARRTDRRGAAALALRVTRAVVVVNPAAGGGRTERRLAATCATTSQRLRLRLRLGRDHRPAKASASRAGGGDAGAPLVVAVGGDGTFNEIVNGVTRDRRRRPSWAPCSPAAAATSAATSACRSTSAPPPARVLGVGQARFDLGPREWPDGRRRYVVDLGRRRLRRAVARRAPSVGGRAAPCRTWPRSCKTCASHVTGAATLEVDGGGVGRARSARPWWPTAPSSAAA